MKKARIILIAVLCLFAGMPSSSSAGQPVKITTATTRLLQGGGELKLSIRFAGKGAAAPGQPAIFMVRSQDKYLGFSPNQGTILNFSENSVIHLSLERKRGMSQLAVEIEFVYCKEGGSDCRPERLEVAVPLVFQVANTREARAEIEVKDEHFQ